MTCQMATGIRRHYSVISDGSTCLPDYNEEHQYCTLSGPNSTANSSEPEISLEIEKLIAFAKVQARTKGYTLIASEKHSDQDISKLLLHAEPPYREFWGSEKKGDRSGRKQCVPPPPPILGKNGRDDENGSSGPARGSDSHDDGSSSKQSRQSNGGGNEDGDDEEGGNSNEHKETTETRHTTRSIPISQDDSAVVEGVSRHVDYLSHDWSEEELRAAWHHIVSNRVTYGNVSRFENMLLRNWIKRKHKLEVTTPPKSLNWWKEQDVIWLYGPYFSKSVSDTMAWEMANNSHQPVRWRRNERISRQMLQRSILNSASVRQAATAVQTQQALSKSTAHRTYTSTSYSSASPEREGLNYASPAPTHGPQTPSNGKARRVHFSEKVYMID